MSSEPKQNSTSGFNSLPLCLGTGGRRENNVIKYSSVEFQILHLLMDVSHHWWGTKGRINSNQTLTQLHYIPVACFRAAGHTKITRPHVSPLTHRNKLKHTGSTKERQWLYSTLAYLGTGTTAFGWDKGAMQPGSRWEPLQLWRTALAEAWSTEPDLGGNVPTGHFQLWFWPSTTQSFTCRLIQTSDTVIEWGPLNGLNLYNTERERQGWGALRKG